MPPVTPPLLCHSQHKGRDQCETRGPCGWLASVLKAGRGRDASAGRVPTGPKAGMSLLSWGCGGSSEPLSILLV